MSAICFADEDMKEICPVSHGTGVESIEFSISDNLDRLERKMEQYQKKTGADGKSTADTLHGPFLDLEPGMLLTV